MVLFPVYYEQNINILDNVFCKPISISISPISCEFTFFLENKFSYFYKIANQFKKFILRSNMKVATTVTGKLCEAAFLFVNVGSQQGTW